MVVIHGFTEVPPSARRRRSLSRADCVFDVFDDVDAGTVLEVATTGSDDRVSPGKRSQTIQLDKAAALTLLGLIEEAFGARLDEETPADRPGQAPSGQPHQANVADTAVDLHWPAAGSVVVPDVRHGPLVAAPDVVPTYVEEPDGVLVSERVPRRRTASTEVNRAIEKSAIELVKCAFDRSGWKLARDRQADGAGYDLDFVSGAQRRKVEVKGIQGDRLEFNLTPKEFWRAKEDPEFLLVAVTGALDEGRRRIHVVSRESLLGMPRIATGYRVSPEASGTTEVVSAEQASWREEPWR